MGHDAFQVQLIKVSVQEMQHHLSPFGTFMHVLFS